jgi:hypothetical protein
MLVSLSHDLVRHNSPLLRGRTLIGLHDPYKRRFDYTALLLACVHILRTYTLV